jgi:hypothetical protein
MKNAQIKLAFSVTNFSTITQNKNVRIRRRQNADNALGEGLE